MNRDKTLYFEWKAFATENKILGAQRSEADNDSITYFRNATSFSGRICDQRRLSLMASSSRHSTSLSFSPALSCGPILLRTAASRKRQTVTNVSEKDGISQVCRPRNLADATNTCSFTASYNLPRTIELFHPIRQCYVLNTVQ